ncbi:M14 family zinc carboxypeptidase [Kitasatospora sp. NPDC097605]|uniref:M14 family zinc carboxypeptidase n=1 Tax=Kitasatospora sp. NPDC097605 TaxID=3157226 RepID=UPI00331CEDD6
MGPSERVPMADEAVMELYALERQRPDLCRVRRIGRSRQGRDMEVLSVGTGRRAALVVGGAHPNEPVGYATVRCLAQLVVENDTLRRDWSWHFLPCTDPDGAALNSGWAGRPLTLLEQHRHFFRPALAEQPEWTFPVRWKGRVHRFGLPENDALAGLVDELKPALVVSLHNADFGAPFHIVDREVPGLAECLELNVRRHGLPGGGWTTDVEGWASLGPGVYVMPRVEELVVRDHQDVPAHGAHLAHYAARYGAVTLLPEVPLYQVRARFDAAPGEVLLGVADRLEESIALVRAVAAAAPRSPGGLFGRAFADTVAIAEHVVRSWRQQAGQDGGLLTASAVAEAHFTRVQLALRAAGMLARALEEQGERHEGWKAGQLLETWAAEAENELRVVPYPLQQLVAVQAGAALAAAAVLG